VPPDHREGTPRLEVKSELSLGVPAPSLGSSSGVDSDQFLPKSTVGAGGDELEVVGNFGLKKKFENGKWQQSAQKWMFLGIVEICLSLGNR